MLLCGHRGRTRTDRAYFNDVPAGTFVPGEMNNVPWHGVQEIWPFVPGEIPSDLTILVFYNRLPVIYS